MKVKTFWLYYGTRLVANTTHNETATDEQVIDKALREHDAVPEVSHLWPRNSRQAIAGMICSSTVKRD